MAKHTQDSADALVVTNADELMRPTTRRNFVRVMGAGGAVVLLPGVFSACSMTPGMGTMGTGATAMDAGALTFDLRSDIGIFRLVHTLEQLEAGAVLDRVAATNLVRNGAVSSRNISNAPTATQGKASANFFPTTP